MSIRSLAAGAALALSLSAGLALPATAAVGDKAGVTASVRGQVQQVSYRTPQAIGRNVGSGDQIFLGDRIVTRAASGVQVMLLDGTTFSIGPDASMVIDEFVYNPSTNTGRLTATLTRGTLRVISGRLGRQDGEAVRVNLPQATVGIRGTMAIMSGDPGGSFIGLFGVGPNNQDDRPSSYLSIGINGTVYNIFRTGYGCTVTAAAPVCNPAPVDPQFLVQLIGLIQGNLREVDLVQFETLTGLNIFQALQMMQDGKYETVFQRYDQVFQDQTRPGSPPAIVPTISPCNHYKKFKYFKWFKYHKYHNSAAAPPRTQWADASGRPPVAPADEGARTRGSRDGHTGQQLAGGSHCY
jgi:hypothetical protein